MDAQEANRVLKKAIGFTDNDLATNRAGNLASTQRTKLSREGMDLIVVAGIFTVIVALIMRLPQLLMAALTDPSTLSPGQIIFLPAIFICAMGLMWWHIFGIWRNSRKALREALSEAKVLAVEGHVRRETRRSKEFSDEESIEYILWVGHMTFSVNYAAYEAFSDGVLYRLYYLPGTKKLLSAERLE